MRTWDILNTREELNRRLPEIARLQYAIYAPGWISARPIFRAPDFIEGVGIPALTKRRFMGVLRRKVSLLLISYGQEVGSNRHCRQQMSGKRKGAI